MATRNQRWMAWSGIVAMVILLIGQWAIAGFVPPPSPDDSAQEIVAVYVRDQDQIRIGLIVATFGVVFFMPWAVAVSSQIRRIEGPDSHPMAWLQMTLGVMIILEFLIPTMMWQAAAFRPENDLNVTQRLHDLASITFVGLPVTAAMQATVLGVTILQDTRPRPVFPRWVGYFSIWSALCFLPGALNPLTKDGPFAWDGVIAWWLGLTVFGLWIGVVTYSLLRDAIPSLQASGQ